MAIQKGRAVMLETKTILVEERHLDAALAVGLNAMTPTNAYCSQCVVGQALSEAFNEPTNAQLPCRAYVGGLGGTQTWLVTRDSREVYGNLIHAFDTLGGEKVRVLLPATIVLQREVGR